MAAALGRCLLVLVTSSVVSVTSQGGRAPYFDNEWFWTMSENDSLGARPRSVINEKDVIRLSAIDPDGDPLTYGVRGEIGRKYFTVDANSGTVKLKSPFDREVDNKYTAKFTVSDGINTVEHEADIRILDVNDNAPAFTKPSYDVTISEDARIGSEVARISASDPDQGYGGLVRYSIRQEDNPGSDVTTRGPPRIPFELRRDSGLLILTSRLDYEKAKVHRLTVVASDRDGQRSLSSSVTVTVNVLDVQDSEPKFLDLPYDRTITEDAPVGTKVVTIRAIDGDTGSPNDIVYSLVAGNEAGKFLLNSAGDVRVASSLDRDVNNFPGLYSLSVRATEISTKGSRGGAFREVSFDVIIDDVNDERARFDMTSYRASVSENTPVGIALPLDVHVKDNDQGTNSDVTLSVSWSVSDLITVSPVTFRGQSDVTVVLKRPLDYESDRRVQFKIFANESNDPKLFSYCDVTINVINENDNAPVFGKTHYTVNVSESTPVGTTIFRVDATDNDSGRLGRVSYFVDTNRDEISVARRSGDVTLLKSLDFERERKKQYIISARDGGPDPQSASAILTINVMDANDNYPVFEDKLPTPEVFENTLATNIATIKATDADSYPNDVISYSIDEGPMSDRFSLETSEDGGAILSVIEPLDFESSPEGGIELTIVGTDAGFQRTTAPLVVKVLDANDHFPVFDKVSNLTVRENIGGGILIGSVHASDQDSGNNGRVNYYVTKGQETFGLVFRLNEQTGDITTKPGISPDFEAQSVYDITVTAQDNGNPQLSAEVPIRIDVIDSNDNAPKFEKDVYDVTIEENSRLNMSVRALDPDSGANGRVTYTIVAGNDNRLFAIGDVSGDITARRDVDFEQVGDSVTLTVRAEDAGANGQLSSTAQVVIKVIDVNDNPPIFARGTQTHFRVPENLVGPVVAKFGATDADSASNGRVTYAIVAGNKEGRFSISPLEGELRVSNGVELDREEQQRYVLSIMAADSGTPPLNATLNVTIVVDDVNDNSPVFVGLPPRVNLSEDTVIGYKVLHLAARDDDTGDLGKVEFSLNRDQNVFVVNDKVGAVYLAKPLDREATREYVLHVTAKDNPRNPRNSRSTTKTVIVSVDDVNDERPRFVGSLPYKASIAENSPAGSAVEMAGDPILAVDSDDGENAEVTYSLLRDPTSYFAIDSSNARIYTTTGIDRESMRNDVIDLVVRATDAGGLYSDVTVTLTVDDVNDNAPRFSERRVKTRVLESVEAGHVIVRLSAHDPDKGRNGDVMYRIQRGAFDKFAINSQDGTISLAPGQSLDRESTSQYSLSVVATDHAPSNPMSSTAVVTIVIDDVNDSRPKFLDNFRRISIHENSPVGSKIAQLVAKDNDADARLRFVMTSATIYDAQGRPVEVDTPVDDIMSSDNDVILGWFVLNSTTGEIRLASSDKTARTTVDRELCSSILLNFDVQDDSAQFEDTSSSIQQMTLQIDIVDQNDNSPELRLGDRLLQDGDDVIVDVTEESAVGSRLMTFQASDVDQGSNGKVNFELSDRGSNLVQLEDVTSGAIFSKSRIDRERLAPSGGPGWINLTFLAHDLGFPSQRPTRILLRMRVNDANDNSPEFSESEYEVSITEDTPVDSIVTSVYATDIDDGDFGDVIYKMAGSNPYFGVDEETGAIILLRDLDRELKDKHTFHVVAIDNVKGAEKNQRQSSVKVTINIDDVNDNSPVFTQPRPPAIVVSESTAIGTAVARVTANDIDDATNGFVTYALTSTSGLFAIDAFTGDVTVSKQVVASERHPTVGNLTVTATDGGGRESHVTIQTEVIDVNDHAPNFVAPKFGVISILEEQPGGTFVTQAIATDDDIGLNSQVRYKLHDPDAANQNAFLIDDVTGRIVTSRRLDREERQTYSLLIQAHDLGSPQLHNNKIIKVIIDDVNDNRPAFPRGNSKVGAVQHMSVLESAKPGDVIGRIRRALDRDQNAKIYYHILSQDGSTEQIDFFAIEGSRLVLTRALDRESLDRYVRIVGATNNPNFTAPLPFGPWDATLTSQRPRPQGILTNRISQPLTLALNPARDSSLLRLVIDVDDVIDEAPRFARHRYVTAVVTSARVGAEVIKMNASDSDLNDHIAYEIISCRLTSADNKTTIRRHDYVINPNSGVISLTSPIKQRRGRYTLKVQARDSANLTATATVLVEIQEKSRKLKFVFDSPPDVVAEQRDKFIGILQNATGSIVTIDNVKFHVNAQKERDVTRSDVTIRVFGDDRDVNGIAVKLQRGSSDLKRLFSDFSFQEIQTTKYVTSSDVMALRVGVCLMVLLLVIVLVIFTLLFFRMRRSYEKEIQLLKDQSTSRVSIDNVQEDLQQTRSIPKDPSSEKFEEDVVKGDLTNMGADARVRRSYTADSPALASSLLWSPSAVRRSHRSMDVGRNLQVQQTGTHDAFEYDITLHATGCDKPLTPLHGSDSGSSF